MVKNNNIAILKMLLQEVDEDPKTFEENPMEFILDKYVSLDNIMTELMTDSYREYLDAVFIVSPKPTSFKVVLHNGQYFYMTYMGPAYEASVAGKNYYLSNVGEKERCMLAISKLLRGGNPLKTKGPEGAEQGAEATEGGESEGEGGSSATSGAEAGGEEGGEALTESILKSIVKRAVLINEAGESSERQEFGLIKVVNKFAKKNPVNIKAGSITLKNIVKAEKFFGRQKSGFEPYTDIVLTNEEGKTFNISMKGTSAPSLAGGGLKGLQIIAPDIAEKFMKVAYAYLIEKKYKKGDKVPDIYGKIGAQYKEAIVVGNEEIGGPIDYIYIGPMDVEGTYKNGTITVNGSLYDAKSYAKDKELYFRLRARREDQTFDPNAKFKDGTPKIYGVSPSKGDSAGRIVVSDKTPAKATVIDI